MFRGLLDDQRLALASRSPDRPGLGELYRHAAAGGAQFLRRAEAAGGELAQALRARGFDL